MTIHKITPNELYEKLQRNEKVFVIDVRAEEKYREYHIEDKLIENHNIPKTIIFGLEETKDTISLPKGKEIIVTCTTGNSAMKCAKILDNRGQNVTVLEGGLTAWKEYVDLKK